MGSELWSPVLRWGLLLGWLQTSVNFEAVWGLKPLLLGVVSAGG